MGNINHNRPHLRYTDNIRKVLMHEQQQTACSKDTKPTSPQKKEINFDFQVGEPEFCLSFLDSIDSYFICNSDYIQNIMGPGKNAGRKSKSDKAEAHLRMQIRSLFKRIAAAAIENKESGLMAFWKYFKKKVGKEAIILDIMAYELSMLNAELGDC